MGQSLSQARLEDRYYLQKVKLGQGSFGTVWRAVDRQTNSVVAIKQLEKAAMPRRGVRSQDIEREINVMRAATQENITRLLDTFEDHSSIYLALEYCDGGDFGDKVKERGLSLEEHEAAEWMRQILSAIAALHVKCICHRDIKPDNFMVHGDSLKLSDFGLALFLPRGRLLTEKCGTPAFMSPEQHKLPRFSRGYTNLVDVWAAGVTMYMLMFGGRHPFLNASQQLDEKRLLQGLLDFKPAQNFFSLGFSDGRYSEPARRLCRRLVEPDMAKRCCAEDVRNDPWLKTMPRNRSGNDLAAASKAPLDPACGAGCEAMRGQSWWPFSAADQAKGAPEAEAELHRKIEMLEEQVRLQQEQNESQWEVMQQLVQEKQKLADWKKRAAAEATTAGASLLQKPALNGLGSGLASVISPVAPSDRSRAHVLPAGTKCRYNSSSWSSWVPAVIQSYNPEDGTYNLDVRPHVKLENISPAPDVLAVEAWPSGTPVHYESSTVRHWLPATIRSFNEGASGGQGTYNLDVRECAQVDRMRPRLGG